jgi:IS4 transposase
VLTDRNFCSYGNISALLNKKVDVVMRMHQSRPADFRKGKALGKNHRLIRWQKPIKKPRAMSQEQFDLLPAQITLRMLRLHISAPGFRTRNIVLVTTLLDTKLYPPESLTELYRRRWGVELFFRDINLLTPIFHNAALIVGSIFAKRRIGSYLRWLWGAVCF